MKKEARLLFEKALDSLLLVVDHFNRPWDCGRADAVLIFFDHAFEMLLKAAILHRGGRIRERRAKQTIGFDACVRKSLSDGDLKFLSKEQAVILQTINSLRDAAQHHIVQLSEAHLSIHVMAGMTLFSDIVKEVFDHDITDDLPVRALAISTKAPLDLAALFATEAAEVRKLLQPGTRRRLEVEARLRGLAIVEGAMTGERLQPTTGTLNKIGDALLDGRRWDHVFPGVASITLTSDGHGPSIDLRITKKGGTPITLVPEGTPGAAVVAVKRVDELGFYSLGLKDLAKTIDLSPPKTLAFIKAVKLQQDADCYKEIKVGRTKFKRYSEKAVSVLNEAKSEMSLDEVWVKYGQGSRRRAAG